MPFSMGTWLERVGITGLELAMSLGRSAGSECRTPQQKKRKKEGRRGFRPWPLRCLSQYLSERKDRLLRRRMFCVPFTDGWPGIYSICFS